VVYNYISYEWAFRRLFMGFQSYCTENLYNLFKIVEKSFQNRTKNFEKFRNENNEHITKRSGLVFFKTKFDFFTRTEYLKLCFICRTSNSSTKIY